jgi:lipopolysaccharide export system permease protein
LPKILDRYLAKEIVLPFTAGLLFLTQLLLATQILSKADVLFGSGVSLLDVGSIVVALLPNVLGYVLPIAFLLGAVIGVGRLSEDREVIALGAAGISPARLVRVPVPQVGPAPTPWNQQQSSRARPALRPTRA